LWAKIGREVSGTKGSGREVSETNGTGREVSGAKNIKEVN
jgi:hypothetical protein